MKFSKKLKLKVVPKWKDLCVDYEQLKEYIKEIEKLQEMPTINKKMNGCLNFFFGMDYCQVQLLKRRLSDSFSSLLNKQKQGVRQPNGDSRVRIISEQNKVRRDFFEKFDEELYKVNSFFEMMEKEFIETSEKLNKKYKVLQDLNDPHLMDDYSCPPSPTNSPVPAAAASHDIPESSHAPEEDHDDREVDLGYSTATDDDDDEIREVGSEDGSLCSTRATVGTPDRADPSGDYSLNIRVEKPVMFSSIKSFLGMNKKPRSPKELIQEGFIKLNKDLQSLKTYRSMNMEAFRKILEKFDMVWKTVEAPTRRDSERYLMKVNLSHFATSDKVVKLVEEVESFFTVNFADNSRREAMNSLKVDSPEDPPILYILIAVLLLGCFIYAIVGYGMQGHFSGVFYRPGYIQTVGPVFRVFASISLALLTYCCNLYAWRKNHINYHYICNLNPGMAFGDQDAFFSSTFTMSVLITFLFVHLQFILSEDSPGHLNHILETLTLMFVVLLILPLNVFFRRTRFSFLRVICRVIISPVWKVHTVDFLMASQLTSMIPMLRDMEFIACYFLGWGGARHSYEKCTLSELHKPKFYALSFLPYGWRTLQCLRRYAGDKDKMHLANAFRNIMALLVMAIGLIHAAHPTHIWFGIMLITSISSMIFNLYWDFVEDWGLLNPKSRNKWLRDELVLKNKSFYYVAIAINILLRLTWIHTLLNLRRLSDFSHHTIGFLLASFEIIRRGMWLFLRMENEYVNNVGKFRTIMKMPMPY